jgi:diguanylate cyclase (GGDEF)-like protein/PAS domain S-box-containing protein
MLNKLSVDGWTYIARHMAVAIVYAISVKLSLAFLTSDGNVATVWIPSGIGLAVFLLGGKKYWLAIYLSALFAYVFGVGRPWMPSTFIALSNVIEPLIGYYLLTQLKIKNTTFDIAFNHSRDYVWLACTSIVVSLVATLIGITTLWLAGVVFTGMLVSSFLYWWMGNTLGIFIVTPLILVCRRLPPNWLNPARGFELIACISLAFLFGQIIFLGWFNKLFGIIEHGYWMFLFITWSSIRFNRQVSALIIGMIVLQALIGFAQGGGYFADNSGQGLQGIWLYLMLLTGVGITMTLVTHERAQANARIKRLTKLYAALSQCNHAIVHSKSESELFSQVCHDAVVYGGMKMAWIGLVDEASLLVKPVAAYGDDGGYLSDINISVDNSNIFSHGPTGTSIKENQPIWCQDFINNSLTTMWRERGEKSGWMSSASLPIHRNGVTIGAFTLYSGEVNTFEEDLRKLIIEMAEDISFALDNFALERARKAAELSLIDSEFRWKFAIEGSGDGVWDWDIQTNKKTFSKRWKSILGYTETDPLPTGEEWENRIHPDDQKYVATSMQAYLDGITSVYYVECRMRCKDGSFKWVLGRGMVVSRDEAGKPIRMVGTSTDITERKIAENELRIAATAFQSQEGILVTDANNIILRANYAFTKVSGYSLEEIIGKTPSIFGSGRHDRGFYAKMWNSINYIGSWEGEVWNRRKNGEEHPEQLTITAVKNEAGIVTNYVSTSTDISLRKAAAEEIQTLAFYDLLTKLPNRRLFIDRLEQTLVSGARNGRDGALLFLDLDNFKVLNDSLGHDFGDEMLQQVAERLVCSVRECDTVARIGGDEFVIMLEDLSEHALEAATQAEVIGEKILLALSQTYQLGVHEYESTASIGVALFSNHNQSQEELMKHADIAMYQAKKSGRNALRFFDPQMQDAINARVDLERELHKALIMQQFQLYYQIQVDDAGQPIGAEALIRWVHPERGLVSPFHFIPLAEETGLILPIGLWVLETACAQLKLWKLNDITSNLKLSINVSAKQFRQTEFGAQVIAAIRHHDIDPSKLKLELTESMLLDNIDGTISTMRALNAAGIRFSLDDFGTGYSSLQYLKRLPLSQLKIDQSFVRDIAVDSSDQAIVRTIIAMAQTLNLNVIAEGVETQVQRDLLLLNGCKHYQGYLFGKPVPINSFEASLDKLELHMLENM